MADSADSADTTAERTRCHDILAKIITNPSRRNFGAAFRAVREGIAAAEFTPPEVAPPQDGGAPTGGGLTVTECG